MFRIFILALSQISAIAFAIFLGLVLFQWPEYSPPLESAVRSSFIFCGICALYWWVQSGSLALSGANTTIGMATDILASLIPILVAGLAIIDSWRGTLPLSQYKQYAAYFAFGVLLLDVTFNTMIMTRLSRRYLGVSK